MSLLSQNKATIEIPLYYKEVKSEAGFTKIFVLENEEGIKLLQEQEDRNKKNEEIKKKKESDAKNKEIKKPINQIKEENVVKEEAVEKEEKIEEVNFKVYLLKTQWKILSWKQQTDITRESSYYNQQESFQDLDIWKFRDLRIKSCLISWDLKDDNGQPIPVRSDIIDQLPADVVLNLVSKYDSAVSLNDEESKN